MKIKLFVVALLVVMSVAPATDAQNFEFSFRSNWVAGFAGLGRGGGTHVLVTNGVTDSYMECRTAPDEWSRANALRRAGDLLRAAGEMERRAERFSDKPKRVARLRAEAERLQTEASDLIASVEPFRVPVGGKCRVAARTYSGRYSGSYGTIGVAVDFYDGSGAGAAYLGTADMRFAVDDHRLHGETLTVTTEDVVRPRRLGDTQPDTAGRSRPRTDPYEWFYSKQ
ncbi:hypothetical protein L0Y40_01305 [Candidatus Wolfebacteria bacterium]|nr:hypothetical protein [Candidatus Wolfebacteria bacterium]